MEARSEFGRVFMPNISSWYNWNFTQTTDWQMAREVSSEFNFSQRFTSMPAGWASSINLLFNWFVTHLIARENQSIDLSSHSALTMS